jgi:anti-anti-sigma regulatory factor
MQVTISNDTGPTAKVMLVGRLDIAGAEVVALPLATLAGGKTNIIVDMSGVTFVSSIGIRQLVLFDHLIGANEGHWGDGDANCSCGPKVQDQFELGRLLDGQVGGLCSFGDTTHIVRSASEHRGEI